MLSDNLANLAILFFAGALGVVLLSLATALLWRWVDRLLFPGLDFSRELGRGNLAVALVLATVLGAFILGLFGFGGRALAKENALNRYDDSFRQATRQNWAYASCWKAGQVCAWQLFKAQGMAESGLRPGVCSHAGACGLMQFMPGTALAMGLQNRFSARASIFAGVAYDRRMWREFTAPRSRADRLRLSLASYNAGLGHVLEAQRRQQARGLTALDYAEIAPALWREPREYVARIERFFQRFSRQNQKKTGQSQAALTSIMAMARPEAGLAPDGRP